MKRSEVWNGALAGALARAQGDLNPALKSAENTFYKTNYATLADCVAALKEAMPQHGLSYSQSIDTVRPTADDPAQVGVSTLLMHTSGEWILGEAFFLPVTREDPQAFGSAISYARRYSLAAITGLSAADDDANEASLKTAIGSAGAFVPNTSNEQKQTTGKKPERAPTAMSPADFSRFKAAMGAAKDRYALQHVYEEAHKHATRLGDKNALNRLTDIKDELALEMATGPQPPTAETT